MVLPRAISCFIQLQPGFICMAACRDRSGHYQGLAQSASLSLGGDCVAVCCSRFKCFVIWVCPAAVLAGSLVEHVRALLLLVH